MRKPLLIVSVLGVLAVLGAFVFSRVTPSPQLASTEDASVVAALEPPAPPPPAAATDASIPTAPPPEDAGPAAVVAVIGAQPEAGSLTMVLVPRGVPIRLCGDDGVLPVTETPGGPSIGDIWTCEDLASDIGEPEGHELIEQSGEWGRFKGLGWVQLSKAHAFEEVVARGYRVLLWGFRNELLEAGPARLRVGFQMEVCSAQVCQDTGEGDGYDDDGAPVPPPPRPNPLPPPTVVDIQLPEGIELRAPEIRTSGEILCCT